MDYVIITFILSIIIFIILVFKAKKNNFPFWADIYGNVIYSFMTAGGVILALSLIAYALTEKIYLGLTNEILRVGILVGGITLIVNVLKEIYEKFDKKKI